MRILGIETSCDETAAAVIEVGSPSTNPVRNKISDGASLGDIHVKVLANVVSSQAKLHAKFGGVVPNLAKREHQKNLVSVLKMALHEAGLVRHPEGAKRLKDLRDPSLALRMTRTRNILEREPELFVRMVEYVLPMRAPRIDAIAVTVGPGLAPALWVGVNFARALGFLWGKPLIPVNHMCGHVHSALLKLKRRNPKSPALPAGRQISNPKQPPNPKFQTLLSLKFPAIALLVSGGHTELVLMRGYGKYRIVGETLDDAAGEAFDKVAKMLGLGFPGGPAIARLAEQWKSKISNPKQLPPSQILNSRQADKLRIKLPRPMINSRDFNFSFSGLKTAVLYTLRDLIRKHSLAKIRPLMAHEFQDAVVEVLVAKTIKAAKQYEVKTVIIGGGVAANKKLRASLGEALAREHSDIQYLIPDIWLTGDNALMIALAGWFDKGRKKTWRSTIAEANLRLDTPH